MTWTGRRVAAVLATVLAAGLLPSGRAGAGQSVFDFSCSSGGSASGDFNNDGRPDLAIGAPGDDLESETTGKAVVDAGSINVVYSDGSGPDPRFDPTSTTRKFFSETTPGIVGDAQKDDAFGFALAAGNFDGIGGDDLAIGIPGKQAGQGAVAVLYSGPLNTTSAPPFDTIGLYAGSPGSPTFNRVFTQDTPNVAGTAEIGDAFGYALASGDINGDGIADLVVGAPKEDIGRKVDAGVVQVLYGTPHGLDPVGATKGGATLNQAFDQGPGVYATPEVGRAEPGDLFGSSLAVGQFDGGGPVDVAVGAPGEDVGQVPDGGAVRVMYSAPLTGLSVNGATFLHQDATGVDDVAEVADRFGCAMAAGDFDGDGDSDLAVGVPGESVGGDPSAGLVQIFYNTGLSTGLSADPQATAANSYADDQVFTADDGGVPGSAKRDDRLGSALVAGDFDGDHVSDLAIGSPTETLYDDGNAGSVRVLYGFSSFGLTDAGTVAFAQSPADPEAGCPGYGLGADAQSLVDPCAIGPEDYSPLRMIEEDGDRFGSSLSAADFDRDGKSDLTIGAPGEDIGVVVNWLTEEEISLPDDVVERLGLAVSLDYDEAVDAGAINVVFGPFPVVPASPQRQDVLYRESDGLVGALRDLQHSVLPVPQDNEIHSAPADPSNTDLIAGDGFGSDQS